MAEIRKHDPDAGDGLGRLVREALGESIRPTQPGQRRSRPDATDEQEHEPPAEPAPASTLAPWQSDGPTFTF